MPLRFYAILDGSKKSFLGRLINELLRWNRKPLIKIGVIPNRIVVQSKIAYLDEQVDIIITLSRHSSELNLWMHLKINVKHNHVNSIRFASHSVSLVVAVRIVHRWSERCSNMAHEFRWGTEDISSTKNLTKVWENSSTSLDDLIFTNFFRWPDVDWSLVDFRREYKDHSLIIKYSIMFWWTMMINHTMP